MQVDEDPSKEPNTEEDLKCVNGTLELKGTYQVHGKEGYYQVSECHSVIAHNAKLELFAPLVFNSTSVEFRGHLTVVAKKPMARSCLRFAGQVVISGDFFVKDCQKQTILDATMDRMDRMRDYLPDNPADDMDNPVDDDEWEDSSLLEATDGYTHGGGIYAVNLILQKSGKITIENCSSKMNGGAIYVEDSFTQEGGDMMIHNCQAGYQEMEGSYNGRGGGIYAVNLILQKSGKITIENCSSISKGGAIYVADSFTQEGGDMMIHNCQPGYKEMDDGHTHDAYGGGIYAVNLILQKSGKITIENCTSKGNGGAIYVEDSFTQEGGDMMIHNCQAAGYKEMDGSYFHGYGGGIYAVNLTLQKSGKITIENCSSISKGGAIYVADSFTQEGGDMMIHNCQAAGYKDMDGSYFHGYGGGIYAVNLILQKSGKITIENCSSNGNGGAIYVEDSFTQEGGDMMIQNCQAQYQGGAVYAENNFTQNNGALRVEGCSASDGGALFVESFRQTGGNVSLSNCKAAGYRTYTGLSESGGGLCAEGFEQMGGWMMIHSCEAKKAGGGLRIWDKIFRQDGELHVRQCSALKGGAAFLSTRKVEQGKSATALVEARQLEATVPSQISGPHTQLVTHKHT